MANPENKTFLLPDQATGDDIPAHELALIPAPGRDPKGGNRFYLLRDHPNKWARKEHIGDRYAADDWHEVAQIVRQAQILYTEARSLYRLPIPPISYYRTEAVDDLGEIEPYLVTVTDHIDGQPLEEALRAAPAEIVDKAGDLFEKLLDYHADKFKKQETFLYDLGKYDQYLYGRPFSAQQSDKAFYFVDVAPDFTDLSSLTDEMVPRALWLLCEFQTKLRNGLDRRRARSFDQRLIEIARQIPSNHQYYQDYVPEAIQEISRHY